MKSSEPKTSVFEHVPLNTTHPGEGLNPSKVCMWPSKTPTHELKKTYFSLTTPYMLINNYTCKNTNTDIFIVDLHIRTSPIEPANKYTHAYTSNHIHAHVFTYAYAHFHIWRYTYIHIRKYLHIYIHTYTYTLEDTYAWYLNIKPWILSHHMLQIDLGDLYNSQSCVGNSKVGEINSEGHWRTNHDIKF